MPQTTDDTIAALMATTPLEGILCAIARVIAANERQPNYCSDATKIRKLIGELSCAGSTFPPPHP